MPINYCKDYTTMLDSASTKVTSSLRIMVEVDSYPMRMRRDGDGVIQQWRYTNNFRLLYP